MTAISCTFAFFAEKNRQKNCKEAFAINGIKISKSALFLSLSAIPMIAVSGLRYNLGVDFLTYSYIFDKVSKNTDTHVEIGFKLLNKLVQTLGGTFSVLIFLCAVITISLAVISISTNSKNYFFSIFLYITMGYFYYSMNSIRHFLALSIFMIAFYFLKKRKLLYYVLLILLAATFHKIALVALPLYFLLNIRYKAYWYGIFTAILLGGAIFHRQLLDFIYNFIFDFYKGVEAANSGYSFLNIGITLALSILAFLYRKKLLANEKSNIILINSAYFGLMFFSLCGYIPVYTRIGQYLTILSLFLIPEILACEEREKVKKLYKAALLIGFLAFMLIMLYKAQNPLVALLPYNSVFSK